MKKKKRKWTRRSGKKAINLIQRVRNRNNRLWMQVLTLALEGNPKKTRKVMAEIAKNDAEIQSWTTRI